MYTIFIDKYLELEIKYWKHFKNSLYYFFNLFAEEIIVLKIITKNTYNNIKKKKKIK